jgi:hypothetical protein
LALHADKDSSGSESELANIKIDEDSDGDSEEKIIERRRKQREELMKVSVEQYNLYHHIVKNHHKPLKKLHKNRGWVYLTFF